MVLESAAIKLRGILRLVRGWPDRLEAVRGYLVENAGLSRQAKIRHVRERVLGVPLGPGELERLSEEYGAWVRDGMMACPMVPGAAAFLEAARGRWPLYVASGTPEEELRALVEARGLADCFRGVYGSPPLKREILRRVGAEAGARPRELLMVGDSMTDYREALLAGVPFVGREHHEGGDLRGLGVPTVADLAGLLELLLGGWAPA